MIERIKLSEEESSTSDSFYFGSSKSLEFVSSGWVGLDCTLGGGWPLTRMSNIVGDESTGKTLLCIEALANFHRQYVGHKFYREVEDAFDSDYAENIGLPVDEVQFADRGSLITVEDFYNDLCRCADLCIKDDVPGAYFLDSLDGLTDVPELEAEFGKSTYGMAKAKQMHKLMRLCHAKVAEANMFLGIVSQTKDKIGTLFPAKTRSGGHALDFWCSQILWLSHIEDEHKTID